MSKPPEATNHVSQTQDIIASLPAPILRLLVLFAFPISQLRRAFEVLFWKNGRRVESWIVVAAWWGLCLGANHMFKYLLPPLVFAPLIPLSSLRIPSTKPSLVAAPVAPSSQSQPSTSETILATLADLHAINALLPPSPIPTFTSVYERFRQLGSLRLVRGLVVIWISWIILGKIIGFRSLLALAGTVLLLLPSPPLAHVLHLLSKSLLIRRTVALVFLFTFGSPPDQAYHFRLDFSLKGWLKSKWDVSRRPSLAFTFRPQFGAGLGSQDLQGSAIDDSEEPEEKAGSPIFFKFEIQENQRWWMGLDWTSALLPQERPSWCDSHLLPVSPPPSFTLPPSSSIILPFPTKSDPKMQIKRTSTWKWLDDDWTLVKTTASGSNLSASPTHASIPELSENPMVSPPNRPLSGSFGSPLAHDDSIPGSTSTGVRAQSIAEQAFTKGLERLKARTASPAAATKIPFASPEKRLRTGSQGSEDTTIDDGGVGLGLGTGVNEGVGLGLSAAVLEVDGVTDNDGWVYGDNKWEGMGPRGGLGKFTRRRRWSRRAVLTESTQRIPSSTEIPSSPLKEKMIRLPLPTTSMSDVKAEEEKITVISGKDAREDVLRLRLKKAMGSVGG
ncbi:hypothetical protein P7C73_g3056, partial [Tremellales sp. Uapishka_1]